MLLNTATVGIFYASIYICKPSEICGRKMVWKVQNVLH